MASTVKPGIDDLPLYDQIAAAVRAEIDAGHLKPHALAPSERLLSERFGVSRMTARAAVRALEDAGYVYRSGRRGTFVSEPRLELPIGSFTVDVARAGHTPRARLLTVETRTATGEVRRQLMLTEHETIHYVRRLRFAEEEPVAIETTHLPCRLFPDLLDQPLEGSLWVLLQERYAVTVTRADTLIEAVHPTADEAQLLQMGVREPAVLLTRTVTDTTGRAIEFASDIYRADRARFRVGTRLNLSERGTRGDASPARDGGE